MSLDRRDLKYHVDSHQFSSSEVTQPKLSSVSCRHILDSMKTKREPQRRPHNTINANLMLRYPHHDSISNVVGMPPTTLFRIKCSFNRPSWDKYPKHRISMKIFQQAEDTDLRYQLLNTPSSQPDRHVTLPHLMYTPTGSCSVIARKTTPKVYSNIKTITSKVTV